MKLLLRRAHVEYRLALTRHVLLRCRWGRVSLGLQLRCAAMSRRGKFAVGNEAPTRPLTCM